MKKRILPPFSTLCRCNQIELLLLLWAFGISLLSSCDWTKIEPEVWHCGPDPRAFTFVTLSSELPNPIPMKPSGREVPIKGELSIANDAVLTDSLTIIFVVNPITNPAGGVFYQQPPASLSKDGDNYRFNGSAFIGSTCPGDISEVWACIFCTSDLSNPNTSLAGLPHISSLDHIDPLLIEAAAAERICSQEAGIQPDTTTAPSGPRTTNRRPLENCNENDTTLPEILKDDTPEGLHNGHTTLKITPNLPNVVITFEFTSENLGPAYHFYIKNANGIKQIDFEVKDAIDTPPACFRLDMPPKNVWQKITLNLAGTIPLLDYEKITEVIMHINSENGNEPSYFFLDGLAK